MWLAEFKDPLLIILIVAAIISFIVHQGEHSFEAYIILFIVTLNATFSFYQKEKADKALDALKKITTFECVVLRDSNEQRISSSEVVPGDIMLLTEGDRIPADGRVFEVKNLKTAEAALSGESMPVTKNVDPIADTSCPLADRKNMVYSSTLVTFGKGKAIVTATGMQTEIGKISKLLAQTESQKTPLQKNIEEFAMKLGKFILVICTIVFILNGPIRHPNNYYVWLEQFLAAIALAVAAIPEGLPLVVTTTLAIGVGRIAKKKAIIKKMHAIESLGCMNTICTDKTGTLTKNEMTVLKIWAGRKSFDVIGTGYNSEGNIMSEGVDIENIAKVERIDLDLTLKIGLLCNNAKVIKNNLEQKWDIIGDPTEACLITAARKAKLHEEELLRTYPRMEELQFDSTRKRMSTIHKLPSETGKSDTEINNASVFARVSPEDKQIIVKALQNTKKIVAMTGDGVNDAPALKKADVGVAMGITGTDVSKEAAAMVLLDDNFATLVTAVEEGRGIYGNIKKFVMYLMTTNIVEVIVLLVASILDFPLPLVATQILFINLIIDGPPAISLAFEPYDPSVMQKPPRSVEEQIVDKRILSILLMRSIVICIWVLMIFFFYTTPNSPFATVDIPYDRASEIPWLASYASRHLGEIPHEITWDALYLEWKARSIIFLIVMTSVTVNVYNCRSETESIFHIPFFSNRSLNYSVLLCIFFIIIIFWPNSILSPVFSIVPLKWELLWAIPTILISIIPIELMKKIDRTIEAKKNRVNYNFIPFTTH
jgi:magnesium-transporting ATPase (P-type)